MEWWQIIILIAACIVIFSFLIKHGTAVLHGTCRVLVLIVLAFWFIIMSPILIFNSIWQFLFLRNKEQLEIALSNEYEKLLNVTDKKQLKSGIARMNFFDTKIHKIRQKSEEREAILLLNSSKWAI